MINNSFIFPPFVFMIAGAFLLPFLPSKVRSAAFLLWPALSMVMIWSTPEGEVIKYSMAGYTLILSSIDSLSRVFGTIFSLVAFLGGVYSLNMKEKGQQSAALLYAGGALGVTFAGDFFTLFIFWELMAVSSTWLIWARRTEESWKAGMRYVLVHLFGGGLLFAGILIHISSTGETSLVPFTQGSGAASWLILAGVAINTAIPPLHAWLVDAYPQGTVTGSVFLSALTTKSAVYVLVRLFPGWDILIYAGVIMALYGVMYAIIANDIREILAYHIISQVGYMVTGVGIGTALSLNGTVAHAFSHILYKALLFMGAGVVLYTTGKSKITELGGFYRHQKVVVFLYLVGGFSISGFPLLNGFISKSMIVSAAGHSHYNLIMLLLNLASVGTFLHTVLKLPYFTWFGEDRGIKPDATPKPMITAMAMTAFLCVLFGVYPSLLYRYLPYDAHYNPYTISHVIEAIHISIFTFIGFWIVRGKLAGDEKISLDTDWFYRRPAGFFRMVFVDFTNTCFDRAEKISIAAAAGLYELSRNPARFFINDGSDDKTYSLDRYRLKMQNIIAFILLVFIVIALTGIYSVK
jgi:multicomponent Na+:H+ antiporter subunit D